ncbi:bestrophin family protein [Roseisolibacter sp. H3M3-2]|uniref:bestrophin family protein n=1 Tax=Roseisolibacter sp. H3M3-2 TaxID=3031323 RepID=UPI0023DB87E0|nr:bestrophin family protein [Roseisolibacter sp. H3M3-2]MDF1502213.1 bestrophin family protein [Roseisolibacter sp. H3M3-2]
MITYDPKNWGRILLDLPRSPVFRTLFLDVLGAGVWAALVAWAELDVLHAAVPLGPSVLSILGIILGLLLVFRTNTAYDRWWEGRRAWGQLLNVTRALSHQLDALLDDDAPQRARYAALLAEYPAALAAHLRRPRGEPGAHVPNGVVRALARQVHRDVGAGALPREATVALTPLLVAFDDVTGVCERIRNTPIPFSYSSYIKQFVLIYALVLPFGLVPEFGYGSVIASMLVFFATMGLELLAGEIEEPFGTDRNDLPTDEIASRAGSDARDLLLGGTAGVATSGVDTAGVGTAHTAQ